MEASVDPQPRGPDWMPITPKRGPFCMPIHTIDRAIAATGHLMQRAKCYSASREMPIDFLDAKGQHCPPATGAALKAPDALAKLLDTRTGNGRVHDLGNGLGG